MSDFDDVLERLLSDQSFAAALAEDPDRTLSGYQLDQDEIELLRSQVCTDTGGAAAVVEGRTTKSSTFGLFSSLGDWSEFGSAAGVAARATGDVVGPGGSGGGMIPAHSVLGDAPTHDLDDVPATARMGDAASTAHAEVVKEVPVAREAVGSPVVHEAVAPRAEPKFEGVGDYRNKVDADGDGHWDKATYSAREDGGVDIMVDVNHDGKVDFIGRDFDRDWKVDEATIDRDKDGVFEKTMYDDNNDGWLDRTVWHND